MSIESQFWPEELLDAINKQRKFYLDIEVVDEIPENILKHAEDMDCWAFVAGQTCPTVVGFVATQVTCEVAKAYAVLNKYGVAKEVIVCDYNRVFRLVFKKSASFYASSIKVLQSRYPEGLFDGRCVQTVIDEK